MSEQRPNGTNYSSFTDNLNKQQITKHHYTVAGNQATLELFRVKDEAEFIALGPWQLSPEKQPDGILSDKKAKEMIETAIQNGYHFFEWTHCHLDGSPFPAEVLLTRMEQMGQVLLQANVRDITNRKSAEEQRDTLISDLQKALSEIKTLGGLLPICSYCNKIRDDKGYWSQIETYIQDHSEAKFSHSICKECADKHFSDLDIWGLKSSGTKTYAKENKISLMCLKNQFIDTGVYNMP